jgi:uncharacterized damage-inducible protein DinB
MSRDLIDQYERGGQKLGQAIVGLDREQLLAAPIPGKWSTQHVVIHLADAESAFADRIKRIIATDNPVLLAWDENQFSARLFYTEQSAEDAVELIDITRRQLAKVLQNLPETAFSRTGQHSERGTQTLKDVIIMANWHLDHHLKFIAEKREKLGK